jgi:hypothetical protein
LLFYFLVTPARDAQNQTAPAKKQASANQSAAIAQVMQRDFGDAVEMVTAFQPCYVVGDFNGDGAEDAALVVRIMERRNALPQDAKLLNPFESRGAIKFPANPVVENKLALAIVHNWKAAQTTARFLLIGESPVLILQHARATSSERGDRQNLMGLMSKRRKRRPGETLPRGSKGDVILLATEVGGDSLLYWNGRTYLWEDSAED